MQVTIAAIDGTTLVLVVGYNGDTDGIFENSFVTIYGTVVGTQSGTNLLGGEISQPLVDAEIIELG